MEIVADASVFLAVVLNESDREWVIDKTSGAAIVSPEILPYEIGNALIAIMKKGVLTVKKLCEHSTSHKYNLKLVPVRISVCNEDNGSSQPLPPCL